MASRTRWTWVWVISGRWWWTGRPGVLRFMGSQRVGHNWGTELNWGEKKHSTPGNDSIFPLFEWVLAQERVFNHHVKVNSEGSTCAKVSKNIMGTWTTLFLIWLGLDFLLQCSSSSLSHFGMVIYWYLRQRCREGTYLVNIYNYCLVHWSAWEVESNIWSDRKERAHIEIPGNHVTLNSSTSFKIVFLKRFRKVRN